MDNGYIYLLFLLLLHCVEWKLFRLISWREWVSVDRQFPQIFEWETRWATRNFSLRKISAQWNEKRSLGGEACALRCVYLFICLLCVHLLFVYSLPFNYFKEAVCWLMHQLCGLAPWSLEGYLCVLVGYFWLVLLWIWCRIWWKDCLLFKFIVVTVYSYLYYC